MNHNRFYLLKTIVIFCLLTCLSGCQNKAETYNLGEWIEQIAARSGIISMESSSPYFLNVTEDNIYYEAVQACTDWGILKETQPFDPDQKLDRRWTAATLVRLMNLELSTPDSSIKDISGDSMAAEMSAAVYKGLMTTDWLGLFHPDELVVKEEALQLLDKAVDYIDNPVIEEQKTDIRLNNDGTITDLVPEEMDDSKMTASFADVSTLREGDVFADEEGNLYQIDEIFPEMNSVSCHAFDLLDGNSFIDIAGSEELDFTNAEIIPGEAEEEYEPSAYRGSSFAHMRQKTFNCSGYKIVLIWSSGNITARVSRTLPHGTQIRSTAAIHNVRADYQWKSKSEVDRAFFKITFDADESLSASNTKKKDLSASFSSTSINDFLSKLKRMFQENGDIQKDQQPIKVASIRIPVAGNPAVNVELGVYLNISVSGKAEISFGQNCTLGAEVCNGRMRMIKDMKHQASASASANTSLSAEINTAFELGSARLMDVGLEGGVEGEVKTTAHLYDSEGKKHSQTTDISADFAEQAAETNKNVNICADVKAYKILSIKANSRKSLLGKLGLSKSFDIFDKDDANLLPGITGHYENGHLVARCTRKDRLKLSLSSGIKTGKQIELSAYAMIVRSDTPKKIRITRLPEGYDTGDLVYSSDDNTIAAVSSNGTVQAKGSGSTVIKVQTKDSAYSASCSVLVPEK